MSLIKLTAELKLHLSSVDKDYKIASLQSFIDGAEQDILVPWIGREIYDDLHAEYNAGTAAGKKLQVLFFLQKAVTNLAFLLAADSGSFRISDSGFYVSVSETNKPVSDKKMSEFKKGRRESGYNALEQAVEFMEANIDEVDFALYKASDQHLQHRAYFINSATEFTRYFKKINNSAYLFYQLSDALSLAERKYIRPVLGYTFFAALKAKVLAKTLNAKEKELLLNINRALANYTIAMGLPGLQVEMDGKQIVIGSSPAYGNSENVENKAAASPQQISAVVNAAFAAGETELTELEDYLAANAADFGEYIVPEAAEDFLMNDPEAPTYFV
jgi:hypothetical protein